MRWVSAPALVILVTAALFAQTSPAPYCVPAVGVSPPATNPSAKYLVQPLARDFGNVVIGKTKSLDFCITAFHNFPIQVSSSSPGPFPLIGPNNLSVASLTLPASTYTIISVLFSPTAVMRFSSRISIVGEGATTTVDVSGMGTAPLSITTPTAFAAGTLDQPYQQTLAASGGSAPYSWRLVTGSLPPGLSLTENVIRGSPTQAGTFAFTISATDSNLTSATQNFTISVSLPFAITTSAPLPAGTVDQPYQQALSATGGTAPYSWRLVSGGLPPGLSLTDNNIRGTPTQAGNFAFILSVTDSGSVSLTRNFAITVIAPLKITTPAALRNVTVGELYQQSLEATGGTLPLTWRLISNSLPPGLFLTGNIIRGSPTQLGTFAFVISVTDRDSNSSTQTFTITVSPPFGITPAALPAGTLDQPYQQILSAAGGIAPYSFRLLSGSLPAGLSLTDNIISGSPTQAGIFAFTVLVTDSSSISATQSFAITVTSALGITTSAALPAGTVGQQYQQPLNASGGSAPYSWRVVTGSLPPGLSLTDNIIRGSPTQAGSFAFTLSATDRGSLSVTQDFTISVISSFGITTPAALPAGTVDQPYQQVLNATGGAAPYFWRLVSGSLPPGLSLVVNVVRGSPSQAGTFAFTISVTDGSLIAVTQNFTVTVNPPLGASPLTTPGFQTIIPHSATGGGFLTRLFITNLFPDANPVTIYRFGQNGTLIESPQVTLEPKATVVIADAEDKRKQNLTVQWFRIVSQSPITASVLFEAISDSDQNAVGALSSPPLNNFTVPLRIGTGANGGVAVVNLSDTQNTVSLNLVDQFGVVKATDSFTLAASEQKNFVVNDRQAFRTVLCPQFLTCSDFVGSLVVSASNSAQSIAALVVGANQGKLFSLPVSPAPKPGQLLQGLIPSANFQTIIPHSAYGGGFSTRLFVTNLSSSPNPLSIYRFDQSGNKMESSNPILPANGTFTVANDEDKRNQTQDPIVQWFAISSQDPITASILFDTASASTRSAVGALSSSQLTSFSVPLFVGPRSTGGVAMLNLTGLPNTVSVKLLDAFGGTKAEDTLTLGAFSQTTFVVTQREPFRAVLCPQGSCDDFLGSLVVNTTSPSQPIAAMVVGADQDQLFSLPVSQTPQP